MAHLLCPQSFIESQVATVDSLLMNAYGTTYKAAIKKVSFQKMMYKLSPTEEMLSAKNVLSNLWSVLDYCCTILYCHYHQKIPNPEEARKKIKFPCRFKDEPFLGWEKKEIEKLVGDRDSDCAKFRGVFSTVQYKGSHLDHPTQAQDSKMADFYRLHFLRNTLTHNSVNISKTQGSTEIPAILQGIGLPVKVAINVFVPEHPWLSKSRNDPSLYECKPLLDLLYNSCKVVEDLRDKMLGPLGQERFGKKFQFEMTKESLIVHLPENTTKKPHNHYHLECYGLEFELKEKLDEMRDKLRKRVDNIQDSLSK